MKLIAQNENISKKNFNEAFDQWKSRKPPYDRNDLYFCVTQAEIILKYDRQTKISKYDKANNLRFDFTKTGDLVIRTYFSKESGLKNYTLGKFPKLELESARNKAKEILEGAVSRDTVQFAIELYEKDLLRKENNKKLSKGSVETYMCRTKKLKQYFDNKKVFTDVKILEIENMLDEIIVNETANYAIELFAELKRVWRFASSKLANGHNIAAGIAVDYVSSRVESVTATELYTDLDSIVQLYANIALAPSIHQKNAIRFMILIGVRPINICNLKWEWVDDWKFPQKITYPPSAMKSQSEFVVPVTKATRAILLEQKKWQEDHKNNCDTEYVFLQPSNYFEPFAIRSLDKLIKDYSPINCVFGDIEKANKKGTNGAFNTMCRKFLKSNIKGLLIQLGRTRSDAIYISKLVMHHDTNSSKEHNDLMSAHYDFSENLFQHDFKEKFNAFKLHQYSILNHLANIDVNNMRQMEKDKTKAIRKKEINERKKFRELLRSCFNKKHYTEFNNTVLPGQNVLVQDLIRNLNGRNLILKTLEAEHTM